MVDVMQVGDVLFMPRGTIHQAQAQQEASCHMTISTYQKWALADFAQAVIAVRPPPFCQTPLQRVTWKLYMSLHEEFACVHEGSSISEEVSCAGCSTPLNITPFPPL